MRRFFLEWPPQRIFQTPSEKSTSVADIGSKFPLPWSAYVRLLSVKNPNARAFYETEALRSGWSVRQLTFRCPVFVIVGEHDYATSHTLAEAWFHDVKAPRKELFRFEDASYMVMQEQPGRFLQHLVNDVRPLAVKSGDSAPDEFVQR